jgi:hypothetical protein
LEEKTCVATQKRKNGKKKNGKKRKKRSGNHGKERKEDGKEERGEVVKTNKLAEVFSFTPIFSPSKYTHTAVILCLNW